MEPPRKAKRYLIAGALIGGLMSLSIALLMDTFYAEAFQGTWRDAVANDLNALLSLNVPSDSIVVMFVFILVLGILSAFGAFMGFIFSFFLYKFFSFLSGE